MRTRRVCAGWKPWHKVVTIFIVSTGWVGAFVGSAAADHPTVGFGVEVAGPITTLAPTPLPKGFMSIGLRWERINFSPFSDAQLESYAEAGEEGVHSVDYISVPSLGLGYGVTNEFTLAARIPYVMRSNIRAGEIEMGTPEVHSHGDSEGLGDIVLLGQYRVVHKEDDAVEVTPLVGIKMPTGKTDVENDGELLETEFQPGSGAWDPLVGLAASKTISGVAVYAGVLFELATEGSQETNLGSSLLYSVAVTYRFSKKKKDIHIHEDGSEHVHGEVDSGTGLDVMVELNGESRDKETIAGESEENSGGTLLLLSPGLRVSALGHWGAFASVGIPLLQDLNGIQTDVKYRVVAGVGVGF